jgi:HD-GYP domain-containing protein (c-di-GMP phosphodiesterase class II)
MSFLIVERGKNAGARVALNSFPITIGRDPQNTIMLDDEQVSRFHLRIKKRGKLYILEDLESRNGTFVNGDRVINSTLHSHDKIMLGSTEYQFFAPEPNIHIKTEVMGLKVVFAENLGLKGPIPLGRAQEEARQDLIRLDPSMLVRQGQKNRATVDQIFDYYNNLLVIADLPEAANVLLKELGKLMSFASRSVFFLWSMQSRQLIPIAYRTYQQEKPFYINKKGLEDAVQRNLTIWSPIAKQGVHPGAATLPMFHNDQLVGLIHVENDQGKSADFRKQLDAGQTLILKAAPIFHSMLLRHELDASLVGMIETMIATIEAKDTYTRGHSERVSQYSMAIADELKLNSEIKRLLMISSLCHDIGKIGIPDAILKKASILSADEYAEMKLHPILGADIIANMPNAQRFISGVKYHHEKWDGTGYPEGLEGEDIPFFARIIAISDAFDALVSGRSYSGFLVEDDAIAKMVDEKDLFDPEILKAFVRAYESGRLSLKTSTQSQGNDNASEAPPPDPQKSSLRKTKPPKPPKT